MRLARRYLEATDDTVVLWIRAGSAAEYEAKARDLQTQLDGAEERIELTWSDLTGERPLRGVDPAEVEVILHAAAVTRFNVDKETARKVNVEGTVKLLEFAGRCPSLKAFGQLSTLYSSGLASGALHEVQADGAAGFANFYESSKHEAEQLLFDGRKDLPWRIFRIATVIADDDSGQVSQFNAFHNTLRLLHSGLLSLVPGEPETLLYFVAGDLVAHPKAAAITLGEMVDLAFETFGQEEAFRAKRILRPVYCDAEAFNLLADGIAQQGANVLGQAVASIAPFARQLFVARTCGTTTSSRPTNVTAPLTRIGSSGRPASTWSEASGDERSLMRLRERAIKRAAPAEWRHPTLRIVATRQGRAEAATGVPGRR